jgi:hypothetical protein
MKRFISCKPRGQCWRQEREHLLAPKLAAP